VLAALLPDTAARLQALPYYGFDLFTLAGAAALISRTGYTGDLGYELCVGADSVGQVWDALLAAGEPLGLTPVGLGARDTLRLEAGFCLHGHDIGPDRNPIEAGLKRFVKLDKGEFVGRAALAAAVDQGTAERLVGLEVTGKGIIRDHCPILSDGEPVGTVTSGTFAPSLQRSIGMGYLRRELGQPGTPVTVEVRGRRVDCQVAKRPFYRPA
jgi:aminomethyltransferase